MMEVVVFTAMVVALSGYVLGFALCRAAAQRDGGWRASGHRVAPVQRRRPTRSAATSDATAVPMCGWSLTVSAYGGRVARSLGGADSI